MFQVSPAPRSAGPFRERMLFPALITASLLGEVYLAQSPS